MCLIILLDENSKISFLELPFFEFYLHFIVNKYLLTLENTIGQVGIIVVLIKNISILY